MIYRILIAFIFVSPFLAVCQQMDTTEINIILRKINVGEDDAQKADNLLKAVQYYLDKNEANQTDIDSAAMLNSKSIAISRKYDLKENIAQGMLFEGEIAIKRGNTNKGIELFNKALEYAQKYNLKDKQAALNVSLANAVSETDNINKIKFLTHAASIYKEIGDYTNEAKLYYELSVRYNSIDNPEASIKYARNAIEIKKRLENDDLYQEHTMLAIGYRLQGSYKEALSSALEAVETAERMDANGLWKSLIYDLLGTIYSELNFHDKAIVYYKKAIAISKENDDKESVTAITINTASSLYNREKIKEALEVLDNGFNYYHADDCEVGYTSLYVLIYCKLKKYHKAQPYYEKLVKCIDTIEKKDAIQQEKMYYAIIKYLTVTGKAKETYVYIDKLKELAKKNNDIYNLSQLEKTHFESDSATGNYLGAIQHLKNYKKLNDSLFNINSAKQFADLQLKYETEKKDKDIKLLKQQSELQKTKLEKEMVVRYIFIASLAVTFIILALLYNRYCIKRKNNTVLEAQQEEINIKNKKLSNLVTEKEWLNKEIHHRVKNNLQVIISLLNTQSQYLKEGSAFNSVTDSRNRMQAMSLIHQKLYKPQGNDSIDIVNYISELITHLQDSYNSNHKINLQTEIDSPYIGVTQATPLGLILNEAISNSIKYAYPTNKKGTISISLKNINDNDCLLEVSDDGVGLPSDFNIKNTDSLGLSLIKGLSKQLGGTFELISDVGVRICMVFPKQRFMEQGSIQ